MQSKGLIPVSMAVAVTAFATLSFLPHGLLVRGAGATSHAGSAVIEAADPDELSRAFEHVAEVIHPSVVSVVSTREFRASRSGPHDGDDRPVDPFDHPFFREFFGDRFNDDNMRRFEIPGPSQPAPFRQQGQASGFVVSNDGYIVTNNHVVQGADTVTVVFSDNREFEANVIGADPQTDLALLKIEATGLAPVEFGDSDSLRVGQWVVAAGNPFGLSASITAGIVSATARARVGVAEYEDFIQTDAAINPGNSGGPLLNLKGEVVGVNTAIFTRTGGNLGVGFAIPSNVARYVIDDLKDDGKVERGWLGVAIQNLNEGLAESFGFNSTEGVLVGDVVAGSPADEAGLKKGDIITRLNGKPVPTMDKLRIEIAHMQPGSTATLDVFRDGEMRTLSVQIGELETGAVARSPARTPAGIDQDLGMEMQALNPELARRFELDPALAGVLVTEVEPYSAAAEAGIRPGDVILEVHGVGVIDLQSFERELDRHDLVKGVRLLVRTGENTRFVWFRVG